MSINREPHNTPQTTHTQLLLIYNVHAIKDKEIKKYLQCIKQNVQTSYCWFQSSASPGSFSNLHFYYFPQWTQRLLAIVKIFYIGILCWVLIPLPEIVSAPMASISTLMLETFIPLPVAQFFPASSRPCFQMFNWSFSVWCLTVLHISNRSQRLSTFPAIQTYSLFFIL